MSNTPTTKLAANPRFDTKTPPAIAKLIGFQLVKFGGGEATTELWSQALQPHGHCPWWCAL